MVSFFDNKTIRIKKILSIALIIFGFYITLSILSNTFDGDLGWHLRFGQDAWNNNFQYTDNYTWGYLGNNWINHEWGGDLVFWFLYNNFGYFSLNIFIAIFLWTGFLSINKVFRTNSRLTTASILISVLALISVKFITVTRLAMLGPIFLVWLLWTLERIPDKKTYCWWPLILWLWSFFHGSWILGFIVINIYLVGNLIIKIFEHKNNKTFNYGWSWITIRTTIIWQIISGSAIMINPYGYKIWMEVFRYFGNNFYKLHITEWLSSYTYPVFWWPLIIACFSAVIIYIGWKNKKITWSQLLLFIAFLASGWMYKRNNLFMVLICVPILNYTWQYIYINLNLNLKNKLRYILYGGTILLIIIFLKPTIHYTNNVWQDKELMKMFGLPDSAVKFLNTQKKHDNNIKVFNTYSWGGYLIWTLPDFLYFADGRSAATWTDSNDELILAKYLNYLTQTNKLTELENIGARYIILQQNYATFRIPTWYDKLIFNQDEITTALDLEPARIYIDLEKSPNWKKVYEDKVSVVWERRD